MPDWPGVLTRPQPVNLSTFGSTSELGELVLLGAGSFSTAGAWPAANRAIYIPVICEMPMTVYQMGIVVGTQSGNCDIGILDEKGTLLVHAGSTAVGATGFQSFDIADTTLNPGVYFLALCIDNTTATVNRSNTLAQNSLQACGVQQQAIGSVTLTNATFANPASAYVPAVAAFGVVTN